MNYEQRCELAEAIADYITEEGAKNTRSGNYVFYNYEINELFGTSLPDDAALVEMIVDELDPDIIADVDTTDGFDLMFFLDYCPDAEDNEPDDMPIQTL